MILTKPMKRKIMEVNFYEEENSLIVVPSGKLDTINAPKFGEALLTLLKVPPHSCLLDLSKVTFLSSSGLQVLLAGAKTSKKENINFAVFGMNEMLDEVFHLSGFHHFMHSFKSKEDALVSTHDSITN